MANMIIWKKSIWDNHFKCTQCGAKLFDTRKNEPTNNFGVDAEAPEEGDIWGFCCRCKNLVAQIKQNVDDSNFTEEEKTNVLNGNYEDWLEKKSADLKAELRAEIEKQMAKKYENQIQSIMRQIETAERSVKKIKADCEKKIAERDKRIQALTKELEEAEAKMRHMEKQMLGRNE